MKPFQLFSRRNTDQKVDFRPDADPDSPFAQLRRLIVHLGQQNAPADDILDCTDALNYLREYTYRKVFTGTSHWEYVELNERAPEVIDWLLAVHEVESQNFHSRKQNKGA